MGSMVANSSSLINSYPPVRITGANSYRHGMRGDDLKEVRRRNLKRLHSKTSWEEIANLSGTDPQYLSQIASAVVQQKGKSPRSLSDGYAEKIEHGLGLPQGWMDEDHESADGTAPAVAESKLQYLIGLASPRSRSQLERIAEAAADGRLSDADVALLETIAKRLTR